MSVRYIFFVSSIITCLACPNINRPASALTNHSIKFIRRDSVSIKEGNYLVYLFLSDSSYVLKWGNKDKFSYSKDTFKLYGNGLLRIVDTSKDVILLQQSCGSDCEYGVVLTLNPFKEKTYDFIKAHEIKEGLVAYISNSDSSFIVVENFYTDKRQNIFESHLCPAAFKGECIDSIGFKNNQLYLRWQGDLWNDKRKDTREKIYTIVI